jgi:hypothetical protein
LEEGCWLVAALFSLSPISETYSIVITALNRTVPFTIASVKKKVSYEKTHGRGELPKASLAFASGNFSTIQLMFSISVNSIASSESVAWPLGQDCTESP